MTNASTKCRVICFHSSLPGWLSPNHVHNLIGGSFYAFAGSCCSWCVLARGLLRFWCWDWGWLRVPLVGNALVATIFSGQTRKLFANVTSTTSCFVPQFLFPGAIHLWAQGYWPPLVSQLWDHRRSSQHSVITYGKVCSNPTGISRLSCQNEMSFCSCLALTRQADTPGYSAK